MPDDIWLTVFSFKPRTELNNCLFVNKNWARIIEGAGAQLPQRQLIWMRIEPQYGPLTLEFTDGDKTKRIKEHRGNLLEPVLKNCIVDNQSYLGRFEDFEKQYQRIYHMAGQKIPFKCFEFVCSHTELARFKENYSSLFFSFIF